MTYQNFIDQTIDQIKPNFSDDTNFKVETITKNNGVSLKALIIAEPQCNILPTIYLEDFYKRAFDGEDISLLSKEIVNVYYHYKIDEEMDLSMFSDFEKVKSRIVFRLVNKARNDEFLKRIPWIPYLDLAVIFCIFFNGPKDIYAGSIIHNTHLESWNTSLEELERISFSNTPKLLLPVLRSLPEFLNDIAGDIVDYNTEPDTPLFVLTNSEKTHGASCILYKDYIKNFADKIKKDIYILPSSIHETMLLPDNGTLDADELRELIKEVNLTQVLEDEYLSDTLYKYNYAKDVIEF